MPGVDHADVVVIGGGHNGLVAAALLARHGMAVRVLEATDRFGGAVAGGRLFTGVGASLSRYSYLVSLFPQSLLDVLGVEIELRPRAVASYTPVGDAGILVEAVEGELMRSSFRAVTGHDAELAAWRDFHAELSHVAAMVAPTLLGPMPRAAEIRRRLGPRLWEALTGRPLGALIEATFAHDAVRGAVLTDALIGTFSYAHDPALRQNRCFLYHVMGDATGEWRVPVGGMAALAAGLERAARESGAMLSTNASVVGVEPGAREVVVSGADGREWQAPYVLANCAPAVLAKLLGHPTAAPEGSQTKVNMVVRRLPRLRSGIDPHVGYAGTLHLRQGYENLDLAYRAASAGQLPSPLPCEVYCHTLTDPSVLDRQLQDDGCHALTMFVLQTPARLFRTDPAGSRQAVRDAALASLQGVLVEPLEDCLLQDDNGEPCVEVLTPLDVESNLAMPGGHIFHGDLQWPWLDDDAVVTTPAQRWGVGTEHPRVMLCGSGAVRGGAVSGVGGHNAAAALLETRAGS
jgi:phytoene dehydrogenase-like protein